MRARRWQRLVDRQPTTTATVDGERRKWLRTPAGVASIVSAALVTLFTGWFTGFFGFILDLVPSGSDAACALSETIKYHWPFATTHQVPSDRFTILIARIDHDDADHTYTRAVERAFFKKDGSERAETCRVLRLGVGRDAEIAVAATARKWLQESHADLLIAGEMQKKDEAISLWFINKDPTGDWRPSTFRLDANLLKNDFSDAASTQLLSVALAAIRPVAEQNKRYLVRLLKPISVRLQHLLEPSTGFTSVENAELQQALAFTLSVIGEQGDDKNALADSANAFRAALLVWTREKEPFRWAATQNNLGTVLSELGERESGEGGIAQLQGAVAALNEALTVWTREEMPQRWAGVKINIAAVLTRLGERESGESGIAQLKEAVATLNEAIEIWTRDKTSLQWAAAKNNLGAALVTLGERQSGESGTAPLKEALVAFGEALEETTPDRAPFDWANTQFNLGNALVALSEREGGESAIPHLQQAASHFAAALSVYIPQGAMNYANRTVAYLGKAVMLLAARRRSQ